MFVEAHLLVEVFGGVYVSTMGLEGVPEPVTVSAVVPRVSVKTPLLPAVI